MPGVDRSKGLAAQLAAFDEPTVIDIDPEQLDGYDGFSREESSDVQSEEEHDAREHYVDVGKSTLRAEGGVSLDPQYAGRRVGRDALEDGDQDREANGHGDGEAEEEDNFDEESSERDTDEAAGFTMEEEQSAASIDDSDHEGEASEEEVARSSDEDEDEEIEETETNDHDHASLRKLMNDQTKSVAHTLSSAATADADRGDAIKNQRKTFDALLNSRIRLQKALICTNEKSTSIDGANTAEGRKAIEAAETAALTLLNNLTSLRLHLQGRHTSNKRSHSTAFTPTTPTSRIWQTLGEHSNVSTVSRDSVLDKWSKKTQSNTITAAPRRLAKETEQQSIVTVVRAQLSDKERLIARTQTPRSCAPGQTTPASHIYDDADFYGLLLKELLEQRSADVAANVTLPSSDGLSAEYRAAREAKTKKVVDTRASKGRKLRYTVHEKLQQFMAPEDIGSWGERQADELFSSLLGKKVQLAEDDVASEDEEEGMEIDTNGFKLFGRVR